MANITSRDEHLQRMETGRQATIISGLVKPYIDNKIASIVHEMAGAYRNREATHDFLLGRTAEITALLNMMSDLERAYKLGVKASHQELGGNAKDSH